MKYKSVEAFEADVRLMFKNCIKFNEPNKDYYFSDLAVKMWNSWLDNREHILLDTEAKISTTSTIKKSADKNTSKLSSRAKRGRDSDDVPLPGKSNKKSKKSRSNAILMDDDDEEFDEVNDNDDDDDDYGFEGKGAGRKTTGSRIGASNHDLFDEESSDEDAIHSKKRKHEKTKKGTHTTDNTDHKKVPSKKPTKKKTGHSSLGNKSSPMLPMVPLRRLSSTEILRKKPVAESGNKQPSSSAVTPSASSSPQPTNKVAACEAMSGADKVQFKDMLRWSVALLRDSELQSMFKQHLCELLLSLERDSTGQQNYLSQKSLGGVLPVDNKNVEVCLWLCETGVDENDGIYELRADPYLLREALPYIMLFRLSDKDHPSTSEECKNILTEHLDFKCVRFAADKALDLMVDVMMLLLSFKNMDGSRKTGLVY